MCFLLSYIFDLIISNIFPSYDVKRNAFTFIFNADSPAKHSQEQELIFGDK